MVGVGRRAKKPRGFIPNSSSPARGWVLAEVQTVEPRRDSISLAGRLGQPND